MAFRPALKEVPELRLCEQRTGLTCALLLSLGGAGELQHVCQLPPECGLCWACSWLSVVVGAAMSREWRLWRFEFKILQPLSAC